MLRPRALNLTTLRRLRIDGGDAIIPRNPTITTATNRVFSSPSTISPTQRLSIRSLISLCSSSMISSLSFGLKNGFAFGARSMATQSKDWSNRPPKETILLDGCDFEHWLVVVEPPDPNMTRDDIIEYYIKTLAQVIGSEEEARMKIYSVSTRHYFAFGCLVSEELSYKLKGEPFINGQAVPYDPKYHELWVRNHEQSQRKNMKNRDRRPSDSRIQRRDRMINRDGQPNQTPPSPAPNVNKSASTVANVSNTNIPHPASMNPPNYHNQISPSPISSTHIPHPSSSQMPLQMQNPDLHATNTIPSQVPNASFQHGNIPPPMQNQRNPYSPVQNQSFENAYPHQAMQDQKLQNMINVHPSPPNLNFSVTAQHMENRNFQRNLPPMQTQDDWDGNMLIQKENYDYVNRDMQPPRHDQNSSNWDMPSPRQNQSFHNRDVQWPMQHGYMPPPVQNYSNPITDPRNARASYQNWGNRGDTNMGNQDRYMHGNLGTVHSRGEGWNDNPHVTGNQNWNASNGLGYTPKVDYQSRDMPHEDYEKVASRNF